MFFFFIDGPLMLGFPSPPPPPPPPPPQHILTLCIPRSPHTWLNRTEPPWGVRAGNQVCAIVFQHVAHPVHLVKKSLHTGHRTTGHFTPQSPPLPSPNDPVSHSPLAYILSSPPPGYRLQVWMPASLQISAWRRSHQRAEQSPAGAASSQLTELASAHAPGETSEPALQLPFVGLSTHQPQLLINSHGGPRSTTPCAASYGGELEMKKKKRKVPILRAENEPQPRKRVVLL